MNKKVFRDPIHNYIEVNNDYIWRLINTSVFQRLNMIKQLGGAFQIFHGALHARFGHSLGVYAITLHMIEKVKGLDEALSEREQLLLLCSALLHDVGHGPFSHASERFLTLHHEETTCRIILEDEEIRGILDEIDASFAADLVLVLQKKYSNPLLAKIVSSQVDVDRMDYLLRDSYYAGVPYGTYDKERIIHVMEVQKQTIVFKESGIYAVEDFMLCRYHMRQQVYLNAKGRAFEILMMLSIKRFMHLWKHNKIEQIPLYQDFYRFITFDENAPIEDFLLFDDGIFMTVQRFLEKEPDSILATLATCLLSRKLPKAYEILNEAEYIAIKEKLDQMVADGEELSYYIYAEKLEEQSVYYNDKEADKIKIKRPSNEIVPIEEVSTVTKALKEKMLEDKYFVYINQKYIEDESTSYQKILGKLAII